MLRKITEKIREMMISLIGNECMFMFSSFFVIGVLTIGPLRWHREAVDMFERYVLTPWGIVLCVMHLQRGKERALLPVRWDLSILTVLAMWIIVPFGLRFGMTFNNVSSWHGFLSAYFGIYAMTSMEGEIQRRKMTELAAGLFALLSLGLGIPAIYCVLTGVQFGVGVDVYAFGVAKDGMFRIGLHHNNTGMIAMLCTLMCLVGMSCRRKLTTKMLYLIPALMMGVVVVLSQSRTSRYSLIFALGLWCYGAIACADRGKWSKVVRHMAGMLAGAVLMVVLYVGASMLTDAALEHYAYVRAGVQRQTAVHLIADAYAQEEAPAQETEIKVQDARGAGEASFTGRTLIWKNLFKIWRENPKHFVIGQGVGRTGSRVVEGTLLEAEGAATMHNTYLQFAADFGLTGFMLLAAFLLVVAGSVLRVFYAEKGKRRPEDRALCALVAACLLTGMMEVEPFASMCYCNALLLFVLGLLVGRDRDMKSV